MVEFRTRHKKPNYSLNHTVKRIAQVVAGVAYGDNTDVTSPDRNEVPCLKDDKTDNWQLDNGNDWFLRLLRTEDEFFLWQLSYRYTTAPRLEALEGLVKFLEWDLGDV